MLKKKINYMIIKIIIAIILTITIIANLLSIIVICKTLIEPNKIPDIFGYKAFLIVDDDENKNINKLTVVFTKNVDFNRIKVGDAIVIDVGNSLVMQRVKKVQVLENGNYEFETTGDSKVLENKLIEQNKVEGVYISKSESLGSFILFIQTPFGMLILITLFLIAIISTQLYEEQKSSKILAKQQELEKLDKKIEKSKKVIKLKEKL